MLHFLSFKALPPNNQTAVMPNVIRDISPTDLHVYDAIIDVRSPAEFAEDHIPGAINLPVLNNEERDEIGTIYVQTSRFLARRKGAAYVAKNIAAHLETSLADKGADFRPLVYCWRGGNRSGAMATIFERIGWHTDILDKGYKVWRKAVVSTVRETPPPQPLYLIDGETGIGKTRLLGEIEAQGGQTICLETLANHKGSVFGGRFEDQPSQKYFESLIYHRIAAFSPDKPIFLEAESSKLGKLHVPQALWTKMTQSKRFELRGPVEARVTKLTGDYQELVDNRARLKEIIGHLKHFHSKKRVEEWLSLADAPDTTPLVRGLLEHHYDPLYLRGRMKKQGRPKGIIALAKLRTDDYAKAAGKIMKQAKA